MLMEDYLLRNKGVFHHVHAFKAISWDNTFEKDPGDCPRAEVLTFQKNAKINLQQGQLYLVFLLEKDLENCSQEGCFSALIERTGFRLHETSPDKTLRALA
ncbi:hypothetical protein SESBI_37984 [Sesbania bispinosa]|nr:hypothetical protein SESBI_37984 [Sesbania bispinosa]